MKIYEVKMKLDRFVILLFAAALIFGCSNNKEKEMLKEKIAQFAETEIKYDESLLDENQKIVVQKLYEASVIIDELFLEQAYSKNPEIKAELEKSNDEYDKLVLEYFNIMFGPFDRLDHHKPFYGNREKPKGANFYPEDMTKEEFETFIKDNPDLEKEFTSEFTVIRREEGKLKAIPYSEFYKEN
jgi:hypothetical protein